MPIFKCTMVFRLSTDPSSGDDADVRVAGWSESWYADVGTVASAISRFTTGAGGNGGLCGQRAALLPTTAVIVGQRYSQVDPPGPAQSAAVRFPGRSGQRTDVPQMALLCTVGAIDRLNIRRLILRGIPDARVEGGEIVFTNSYRQALTRFFNGLNGWNFRGRDLSQVARTIVSITAGGLCKTELNNILADGDMARVLRTNFLGGGQGGKRVKVTVPGLPGDEVTLQGWDLGACIGGKIRKDAIIYPRVDPSRIEFSRVITRRAGRPSNAFRGRR